MSDPRDMADVRLAMATVRLMAVYAQDAERTLLDILDRDNEACCAAPSAPEPERRERGSLDPDAQEPDEMLACDPRCERCCKWRIEGEAVGLMDAPPPAPAVPSEARQTNDHEVQSWCAVADGASVPVEAYRALAADLRAVLARLGRATPQ